MSADLNQPLEDGAVTFADPTDAARFYPGMHFMFSGRPSWWKRPLRWLGRKLGVRPRKAGSLSVTAVDYHGGVITVDAGAAAKAAMSLTKAPAGRIQAVMDLLAPVAIETCPTCGGERRVVGPPMITKEQAAEMLDLPPIPDGPKEREP